VNLADYIASAHRAGFGGLRVVTHDEEALLLEIRASLLSRGRLFLWSTASGIWEQTSTALNRTDANLRDPWEFLLGMRQRLTEHSTLPVTYIMQGLEPLLDREPVLRRALIEGVRMARAKGHMLLLVGHSESVPGDLADEFGSVWHSLPSREQAQSRLIQLTTKYAVDVPDIDLVLDAAQGLTLSRMSDAFSLAIVRAKESRSTLSATIVREFKETEIGKRSYLKVQTPSISFSDLIGHDYLKSWLLERRAALSPAARAAGLPSPKGVLLVGPPGTGKSRFVEATATEWGVPWLTLDASGLYGSLLGESESRLAEAIEIAERMSPCVLLVDEVERGFSNSTGDRDGGTQERVLGKMLTWMSSKTSPVFVVMTSNFADRLPAALIRKGRLDETFMLDFPSEAERLGVFAHYLSKAQPHHISERNVRELVHMTDSWSPSEIEAVVLAARFTAFAQHRQVEMSDLTKEIERTVPVSRSMHDQVMHMRAWAQANARPTSYPDQIMISTDRVLQA
jgi:AAA+ superfamily predicted ATPase